MSPNLQRNDYVIYTDASYRNDKSGSNAGIAFLIYNFEMKLVDAQCKHVSVSCVQEAEAKAVEFALQNLPADAKRVKVLNDNGPVVDGITGYSAIPDGAYGTVYSIRKFIDRLACKIATIQIPRESKILADSLSNYALDWPNDTGISCIEHLNTTT